MNALLDTNIIIHREASRVINQDVGILYRWLERAKYTKWVHSLTIAEIEKYKDKKAVDTFHIKLDSYERIEIPSPLQKEGKAVSAKIDVNENDRNDSLLLNEVFIGRDDILISEDKKIHKKAKELQIDDKVITLHSFLENNFAEHPDQVNYKVLIEPKLEFGRTNREDDFLASLQEDYLGGDRWVNKKYDDGGYITVNSNNGLHHSF